eukprot:CAMPEP_0177673368 /NCGR_PEP_ID=MMETSP0447-20121125/25904_1 /TAXON_ID=0 /ORGANISM="Stygamoeba regulata, Strain BSH-02190019" /LENGTH=653 /DNA_ID=CAMNT_0019181231 /DNA_START=33 /DNA_END=1990 /DNA_ORIENTATION=+
MFIPPEKLDYAYNFIREDAGQGTSVVIFVGPDADALCACHILTTLLRMDQIPYQIKPIFDVEHLLNAASAVRKMTDVRSIIMLNCGGSVDILQVFQLPEEGLTCYVTDCHRPFHLANINDKSGRVLLIGDQDDVTLEVPEPVVERDEDDFSSSDSEVDASLSEDLGSDSSSDGNGKRKRTSRRQQRKEKRRKAKSGVDAALPSHSLADPYYAGDYCGPSSSGLMYLLAYQLSRNNETLLWHAVVGLTNQWTHHRIDYKRYEKEYNKYRAEVDRLYDMADDDDEFLDAASSRRKKLRNGRILCELDYKFMLYRHWSLYDSMFHSRYVAARLRVWTYRGPQKLQELLAKMGLPLRSCKESWALMSSSIKQQLDEKLTHCGATYELPELQFPSFVRNFGYKMEVCAEDVVYAVTALLELNNHDTLNDELVRIADRAARDNADEPASADGVSATETDSSGTTSGPDTGGSSSSSTLAIGGASTIHAAMRNNFWTAYEALDSRSQDLARGFQLAMSLQKAIVRQGAALLEKKALRKEAHYRRCVLDHSHTVRQGDASFFCQPLALIRLALFLASTYQESRLKSDLPVVLAAHHVVRDTFLVVGVSSEAATIDERNVFGMYFKAAAQKCGAVVQRHYFESPVLEVKKDDLANLLDCLTV